MVTGEQIFGIINPVTMELINTETGVPVGAVLDPVSGKPVQPSQLDSPKLPNISAITATVNQGSSTSTSISNTTTPDGLNVFSDKTKVPRDPAQPAEEITPDTPTTEEETDPASEDEDEIDMDICIPIIEAYTEIILDGQ